MGRSNLMVRPALPGTSNLTPLAGPSNPRLAGTAILARATPTGAERARRYRLNKISALCRTGGATSRETAI